MFRDVSDLHYTLEDVKSFLVRAAKLRVCLLGETIIDEWVDVTVENISQKSRCVAGLETARVRQVGGSGVIALHLAGFVKQVDCFTNGLAVLIACLGLFALAAHTTERRTKEIGVRKAMGADTRQVVMLLLWQFTVPVLIAIAIAIPIGFLAMDWWLQGFAYHTPLSAWTFVLAAVSAVGIAWLTVSYQSYTVARARPSSALRYE